MRCAALVASSALASDRAASALACNSRRFWSRFASASRFVLIAQSRAAACCRRLSARIAATSACLFDLTEASSLAAAIFLQGVSCWMDGGRKLKGLAGALYLWQSTKADELLQKSRCNNRASEI